MKIPKLSYFYQVLAVLAAFVAAAQAGTWVYIEDDGKRFYIFFNRNYLRSGIETYF